MFDACKNVGFDACIGDPIGHYNVTPEAYGYFTHWLSTLANGKVILCLEGGYNVNSISHAMSMCAKALLGDPLPMLHTTGKAPNLSCIETIQNVLSVHQKYWKSLKFNKKLPSYNALGGSSQAVEEMTKRLDQLKCSDSDSNKPTESCSSSKTVDDQQPGSSSTSASESNQKNKTLLEFLQENRDALFNEEMFAVNPRSDCPHLVTLKPESLPDGKFLRHFFLEC